MSRLRLFLSLCGLVAAPVQAQDARATLDAIIPAALVREQVPSLSFARIREGRIDMVAAWGMADELTPASPDTIYNIASLTKPLAAQIILMLATQGVLTLDEPMARSYVDPDVARDPRTALLTARLSLTHRTGFPNWRSQTGGQLSYRFTPGSGYGYSGEGMNFAARFAEARTGRDLQTLGQAMLFGPLGMTRTSFTGQSWFIGRMAAPSNKGVFHAPDIAERGMAADEAWTSASDYARFLESLIAREGLSPALADDQIRFQIDQTASLCNRSKPKTCPTQAGFGLGWQALRFGKTRFYMHTGNDRGEFTFAYWSPDTREGGVILTNSQQGDSVMRAALDAFGFDRRYTAYLKAMPLR